MNFKLFLPGESKSSTLIPFVTELQEIYNINSATIVAKNEICTKKNIEALRQIGWELINNTTAVVKNKKQSGLISTKLKDLKDSELRELYSREDLIRNTWSFLKNELFVTSRISLSAEHVDKYSCLCLMSLMVLRYTIYIINSELGLQGKNKFTESKLNDIAMGVIRIIILTDGVETDSFKFSNSHTDEIWNLYESIKKCLLNKYPQIENNK
ncbi:hypothetical protein [Mycoplasmopsis caviae]|uniref:Uncharacterized protein n=1 Tax=Mycoplasmopsis caviae TaxID=55603 RepID=A0A3P8MF81_9BACT|nr:hypothetical protein [Mycoplasmopsis caviae]VDR41903.1 Uncharacterised protein [Mycoplasmopsis caviae]